MTLVAIDGPAGAGKSTVARAVADALGFTYVNTGAMYRAITAAAIDRGVPVEDQQAVEALARQVTVEVDGASVRLDGRDVDVASRLHQPDIASCVSIVSAYPGVRSVLAAKQRAIARRGSDIVMEGRDIGTVVAPDAAVKVFLTASLDERAQRRARQLGRPADAPSLSTLQVDLAARDEADSSRETSPFRKAADAFEVDSTGRSVESVVEEIVALVRRATVG